MEYLRDSLLGDLGEEVAGTQPADFKAHGDDEEEAAVLDLTRSLGAATGSPDMVAACRALFEQVRDLQ